MVRLTGAKLLFAITTLSTACAGANFDTLLQNPRIREAYAQLCTHVRTRQADQDEQFKDDNARFQYPLNEIVADFPAQMRWCNVFLQNFTDIARACATLTSEEFNTYTVAQFCSSPAVKALEERWQQLKAYARKQDLLFIEKYSDKRKKFYQLEYEQQENIFTALENLMQTVKSETGALRIVEIVPPQINYYLFVQAMNFSANTLAEVNTSLAKCNFVLVQKQLKEETAYFDKLVEQNSKISELNRQKLIITVVFLQGLLPAVDDLAEKSQNNFIQNILEKISEKLEKMDKIYDDAWFDSLPAEMKNNFDTFLKELCK